MTQLFHRVMVLERWSEGIDMGVPIMSMWPVCGGEMPGLWPFISQAMEYVSDGLCGYFYARGIIRRAKDFGFCFTRGCVALPLVIHWLSDGLVRAAAYIFLRGRS